MIIFGTSYEVILDSKAKTIMYIKKSSMKRSSKTHSFQDVEKVETRSFRGLHSNQVTVLQSFLVLKNGTRLMLDYQHGPRARVEKNELESAKLVADFIGVGFATESKALNEESVELVER